MYNIIIVDCTIKSFRPSPSHPATEIQGRSGHIFFILYINTNFVLRLLVVPFLMGGLKKIVSQRTESAVGGPGHSF
jgi:hypothetical protein